MLLLFIFFKHFLKIISSLGGEDNGLEGLEAGGACVPVGRAAVQQNRTKERLAVVEVDGPEGALSEAGQVAVEAHRGRPVVVAAHLEIWTDLR